MIFKLFSENIEPGSTTEEDFVSDFPDDLAVFIQSRYLYRIGLGFYSIFNTSTFKFDLVSNGVEELLGYEPSLFDLALVLDSVHPDDKTSLIHFSIKIKDFFSGLPPEKLKKYNINYDYRFKIKNGSYIRLLHQSAIFQQDGNNKLSRTINIQTDISHLKKLGLPTLSIIGLEGEPSYIDIGDKTGAFISTKPLSAREKEVLVLLCEGKLSKEISAILNISKHTVDNHRKRMLLKCQTNTTAELIGIAIKSGWID